ncbi:MAG: M28 family peptidase [Rhodothermales bacterium]|nr:M28 family peptidase [Rhodothermales bacterium]MBO6781374.1 M28 family peptidase [Rhodothermales bacterium]
MKQLLPLLTLLLVMPAQAQDATPVPAPATTPTADDAPDLVRSYQETISASDLAAHLYFFASDHFEGRETATRGQRMAAEYLAAQYRKMGITPAGTAAPAETPGPQAYLQPFPLYGRRQSGSELTVPGGRTSVFSAANRDGHSVLVFGDTPETTAGVVFGGHGIADAGLDYDDFAAMKAAGLDYSDKWLMLLADEPMSDAETSLITADGTPSRWSSSPNVKLRYLFQSGLPKGVLLISDSSPRSNEALMAIADERAASLGGVGSLSLEEPSGSGRPTPPIMLISSDLANSILAPSGRTVADIRDRIAADRAPVVFDLGDAEVSATIQTETYETSSENVVAFIEGSDPQLRHEVVVVSSHYDHVGMTGRPEGEDQVFNGADDDGSGTVAVLEIAEAFEKARADGHGPRRSVVFLNVSGEEKGLLGSRYYTDAEPIFDLDNTVANLNIDMIGRVDPTHPGDSDHYVYIIGSNLISQELHDLNGRMNTLLGTDLDLNERFNSRNDPNQFYRRSDHWNFGKHEIPFIFFFTGTHEDYHGPGDEPHKIEYDRLATISRLIFATAWQVANQDARPAVSGTGFN